MTEESLKHRLFPFSLKEKANAWLLSLQPRTITTWIDLIEAFYRKFYSKHKTASACQTLNTFHQLEGEIFLRSLRDLRTFYLSVLTMNLKKFV